MQKYIVTKPDNYKLNGILAYLDAQFRFFRSSWWNITATCILYLFETDGGHFVVIRLQNLLQTIVSSLCHQSLYDLDLVDCNFSEFAHNTDKNEVVLTNKCWLASVNHQTSHFAVSY